MSARAKIVRDFYTHSLRESTQQRYDAYLQNEELDHQWLQQHRLRWEPWRENAIGLPESVFAAYSYYIQRVNDTDLGGVSVYRVPVDGVNTFLVRVTTDGDDGWLEVFDHDGTPCGAARYYIEVVAWGDVAAIRAMAEEPFTMPKELNDASQRTLWGK